MVTPFPVEDAARAAQQCHVKQAGSGEVSGAAGA
jgi:hypothetical protein